MFHIVIQFYCFFLSHFSSFTSHYCLQYAVLTPLDGFQAMSEDHTTPLNYYAAYAEVICFQGLGHKPCLSWQCSHAQVILKVCVGGFFNEQLIVESSYWCFVAGTCTKFHNLKVQLIWVCSVQLTLSVPSNSVRVASPRPSNIWVKRSFWVEQERRGKNAHIWQLTLQCCHHSLTQFYSPPPQFIQNQVPIHHPIHHLYACFHHPWKVYIQCFRKRIFSLTSHRIYSAVGSDRVLSLHWKEIRFETSFSLAVFSETTKIEFLEQGPHSAGSMSTTMRNESLVLQYGIC